MSNESSEALDTILGQLEDELRSVKSARDQVDEMVSVGENLGRLVLSSNEFVEKSGIQMRETAAELSTATERLSERSEAIERITAEGVEAISAQASNAQDALGQLAESVSAKASSDMTRLAEQSVAIFNDRVDQAVKDNGIAGEELRAAATDITRGCDALIEAHASASEEIELRLAENKELLEEARSLLSSIDERVATLEAIDVDGLVTAVAELESMEANNTAMLKKQLASMNIMIGVCIAVGIAILVAVLVL